MSRDHDEPSANPPLPGAGASPAQTLVDDLARGFVSQIGLVMQLPKVPLASLGSAALAYADHYLSLIRSETREPIVSLIAAQVGAWFGELVRQEVGGTWIGDGKDPRRLRLLLEPQFLYFSPIDLTYEAIFVGEPAPDDPRIPDGAEIDGAFHLRKRALDGEQESEHEWVSERLAEAAPVPEDQFYSLTGRFETLTLILELLASRALGQGREPTPYHLNDYVRALAEDR
jgi:hypothetical protein